MANLREIRGVAAYFLTLGTFGFGGPAAHIAAMERDLVERRQWVDRHRFLEVVGVTNLIPGPNSSEVAMHLGYLRAGVAGGVVAGVAFALPAVVLMTLLSALYFSGHDIPARVEVLLCLQPVVIAVLAAALWRLRAGAAGGLLKPALFVVGLIGALAIPRLEPLVLIGCGVIALLARGAFRSGSLAAALPLLVAAVPPTAALTWVCFRTGLLLFGGGYVLVPLLEPEVTARGWLTTSQFLDGVALGQATPGPIVTTVAFVGYAVSGLGGAIAAVVAIYLPSFLAVLAGSGPFLRRFRERPGINAFVTGVVAASLGAIAAVGIRLGETALDSPAKAALFVAAGTALLLWRAPVLAVVSGAVLAGIGAAVIGLTP